MPDVKTLDLRGQICPDPLMLVQDAMKGASPGDTFLITVDYPLAVENIARWAESNGHAVEMEQKGTEWEVRITVG